MGFIFKDTEAATLTAKKSTRPAKIIKEFDSKERGCDFCPLQELWPRITSPILGLAGSSTADVFVVGENPSEREDREGEAFSGDSGKLLRKVIPSRHLERVAFSHATRCHTLGGRTPSAEELHACSLHFENDLLNGNFKYIIGIGSTPLSRFIPPADTTVRFIHGIEFPVEIAGSMFGFPVFNPAYMKDGERSIEYPVFAADIKRFFRNMDKLQKPIIEKPQEVIAVYNKEEAYNLYSRLGPEIGIDLETSVLKPYQRDARLLAASFSDGPLSFAFPVEHPEHQTDWGEELLLKAAQEKIWAAHNAAMELVWLLFRGRRRYTSYEPNRYEDSMAYGRLAFGRKGILGLGTLSRLMLGTNIKRLSDVDAANIMAYPLEKILPYNAIDSWGSIRIHKKYRNKVNEFNYEQLLGTIRSTVEMELMGLPIDMEEANRQKEEWHTKKQAEITTAKMLYEVKAFEREKQKEFNIASPTHVGDALVEYGRLDLPKTPKGQYVTDDSELGKYKDENPLVKSVLAYREAAKHEFTYIDPILEVPIRYPDGNIHPSYTTMQTHTLRLSFNDPNIQNYPTRRHREVRHIVKAPHGYVFVPCDYGAIQGRIYGMASKDTALCNSFIANEDIHIYWLNKTLDIYPEYIHRLAEKTNQTDEAKIRESGRNIIKTDFVFASFFGTTAPNCSERTNIPFMIIQDLLNAFWGRYPNGLKYLIAKRAEYRDTGGVMTLTGRQRYGVMEGNEPIITPIQGGEAEIVRAAQNELSLLARETGDWHFHPRINVHDDLTFLLPDHDDKLEMYVKEITRIMTKVRFKWQIVPLMVDVKMGKDWCDTEKIAVITGDYVH